MTIYEWGRILDPEWIDVGSHVHVASLASLVGGGRIVLEDLMVIAGGSRLVSDSDRFDGSGLSGPTIPDRWGSVSREAIHAARHAVLGTNVVVHPGVTIGEGTIVGSNSLVTGDLPSRSICIGTPAKPVRERPHETMLGYERELLKKERSGS